jgi:hypothetical protein
MTKHPATDRSQTVSIQLKDLEDARKDARLRALLTEAAAEDAAVDAQGRRRW